jgi:hypothetical protein
MKQKLLTLAALIALILAADVAQARVAPVEFEQVRTVRASSLKTADWFTHHSSELQFQFKIGGQR